MELILILGIIFSLDLSQQKINSYIFVNFERNTASQIFLQELNGFRLKLHAILISLVSNAEIFFGKSLKANLNKGWVVVIFHIMGSS